MRATATDRCRTPKQPHVRCRMGSEGMEPIGAHAHGPLSPHWPLLASHQDHAHTVTHYYCHVLLLVMQHRARRLAPEPVLARCDHSFVPGLDSGLVLYRCEPVYQQHKCLPGIILTNMVEPISSRNADKGISVLQQLIILLSAVQLSTGSCICNFLITVPRFAIKIILFQFFYVYHSTI